MATLPHKWLHDNRHCINDIRRWQGNAQTWADAIRNAGSPFPICIGFIDGTIRGICRPVRNQRTVYCGYKKTHAIKFQAVVGPNGLIVDLAGPYPSPRGDGFILRSSRLINRLAELRHHHHTPGRRRRRNHHATRGATTSAPARGRRAPRRAPRRFLVNHGLLSTGEQPSSDWEVWTGETFTGRIGGPHLPNRGPNPILGGDPL